MKVGDKLWRAYGVLSSGKVMFDALYVVRVTPSGMWLTDHPWALERTYKNYWIDHDDGRVPEWTAEECAEKWSGATWRRFDTKYASQTMEKAEEHLRARTAAWVRHCERRLEQAWERARRLGMKVSAPTLDECLRVDSRRTLFQ